MEVFPHSERPTRLSITFIKKSDYAFNCFRDVFFASGLTLMSKGVHKIQSLFFISSLTAKAYNGSAETQSEDDGEEIFKRLHPLPTGHIADNCVAAK